MPARFLRAFLPAWLAGFCVAVAIVVLLARDGSDRDVLFVAARAAICAVPLGLVTVVPMAMLAWKRPFPLPLVLFGGIVVGSLPGLLQFAPGAPGALRAPPAGTHGGLHLAAAVGGAFVGSCLYGLAVDRRRRAA